MPAWHCQAYYALYHPPLPHLPLKPSKVPHSDCCPSPLSVQKLKQQEADLRVEVDVVRGRVAEMKEAAVSDRTRCTILNALLKAKRTGAIPGIYGRLGDLGGIDGEGISERASS